MFIFNPALSSKFLMYPNVSESIQMSVEVDRHLKLSMSKSELKNTYPPTLFSKNKACFFSVFPPSGTGGTTSQ